MHETAEPLGLSGQKADAHWAALSAELDRWAAAGQTATFWWRDDDAGEMADQLKRLLALRDKLGIALALATVPTHVDESFRSRLTDEDNVAVLQHGYSHHNFATPGERKIELDGSRPAEHVIAELAVGMQSLVSLAGWVPVLVPPWNRIAPHLLPPLPELGYRGLSGLGPRLRANPLAGLRQNNVHIDPIDWRGRYGAPRDFGGTERAVAAAIEHLTARRTGAADGKEATGLMTHHLIQNEDTWRFVEQFIAHTKAHLAVKWVAADDIFELAQ